MTDFLVRDILGSKICLLPGDDGISRVLQKNDTREGRATEIVRDLVQPGWVCLDIGASVGYYTLFLSTLVGPDGLVLAVEPVIQTVNALRESIRLNGYTNIEVYETAIGSSDTTAQIHICTKSSWATLLDKGGHATEWQRSRCGKHWTGETQETPVTTVDSLVGGRGVIPQFIKMDIQGYEHEGVEGMSRTLRRPELTAMLIEFHRFRDNYEHLRTETLRSIRDAGFSLDEEFGDLSLFRR